MLLLPSCQPLHGRRQHLRRALCLTAAATCRNLLATEKTTGLNPYYLEQHDQSRQPTLWLDGNMRMTAVSWLVEVASEYHFHPDTLFVAISLLDRLLSHTQASAQRDALPGFFILLLVHTSLSLCLLSSTLVLKAVCQRSKYNTC